MGKSSSAMEAFTHNKAQLPSSPVSTESTFELLVTELPSQELDSPPANSCLPDDEAVRNDIVSAVEDIIAPRVQSNLAAFKCANEMSFDLINEWIDLVGDESGLQHISAGSPIIAGQVADVLEQEAAGAASSATEIVQTIAEVIAENILNPGCLIDRLSSSNLMDESMPSCGLGDNSGPTAMDMMNAEGSDLMNESLPSFGLANTSLAPHDNLDNEQEPLDMLMLDQSPKCNRRRSISRAPQMDMSDLMNESMPEMEECANRSQSQLQLQLTQLENLLAKERLLGMDQAASASIVVNQTKAVGTVQPNSCGQMVPTVCGTTTTTTTTIEPPARGSPRRMEQVCAPSFLDDVAPPDDFNQSLECDMSMGAGTLAMDDEQMQEVEDFRRNLRAKMSDIINQGKICIPQSPPKAQANCGITSPRRAEMMARVATMQVQLPDVGNCSDLFEEEEMCFDEPEQMPDQLRGVQPCEIFQEVPSDERAIRITNAFINDRMSGTQKARGMIDCQNMFERRLLIIIETRLNEAIRGARGLFGADFGTPCFPVRRLIDYVRNAVVEAIRELRFEQIQNRRCAAGEAPLVQYGPQERPMYDEPIYPLPEHMSAHTYEYDVSPYGPYTEEMTPCVYEPEPVVYYGPELMYGPWDRDYYGLPKARIVKPGVQGRAMAAAQGVAAAAAQGRAMAAAGAATRRPLGPNATRAGAGAVPKIRTTPASVTQPRICPGKKTSVTGGMAPKAQTTMRVPLSRSVAAVKPPTPPRPVPRTTPSIRVPPKVVRPTPSPGSVSMRAPSVATTRASTGGLRTPATGCARPASAGPSRPSGLRAVGTSTSVRASTGSVGLRPPSAAAGACGANTRRSTPAACGNATGPCKPSGLQQQATRMQQARNQAAAANRRAAAQSPTTGKIRRG